MTATPQLGLPGAGWPPAEELPHHHRSIDHGSPSASHDARNHLPQID